MSFFVKHLRVYRGQKIAFDEAFESGLNVIQGENSSGKSTILKLLYHGIGGSIAAADWTESALECDRVFVECNVGGNAVTLGRAITTKSNQPIIVNARHLEDAVSNVGIAEWQEYRYSRNDNTQSFSQFIFMILGMPEAFSEESDFLTFHQFLRIHYADQESSNHSIMKEEDAFDKATTREAVGNFVLGAFDNQLTITEQRLREAELDLSRASISLTAGVQLLGADFDELNLEGNSGRQAEIVGEIATLRTETERLSTEVIRPITRGSLAVERVEAVSRRISELNRDISELSNGLSTVKFSQQDSALFIATLRHKLEALTEAGLAAKEFGTLTLEFCPACGTAATSSHEIDHCYLCKSEVETVDPERRLVGIIQSTQGQLEQSLRLQRRREIDASVIERKLSDSRELLSTSTEELEQLHAGVVTDVQAELTRVQNRLGFLSSQLERLKRDRMVIERIQAFRDRKDQLNADVARLKSEIDTIRAASTARVGNAMSTIAQETRKILSDDLDRQAEFGAGEIVSIDYRANRYALDGKSSFSASSQAYFRNAVYLATLLAASRISTMRHLKFLMLENLEDKGMEPERYHNFHEVILRELNKVRGPWQAIIATADWNPSLTSGYHAVGRRFTHDRKSLDL